MSTEVSKGSLVLDGMMRNAANVLIPATLDGLDMNQCWVGDEADISLGEYKHQLTWKTIKEQTLLVAATMYKDLQSQSRHVTSSFS